MKPDMYNDPNTGAPESCLVIPNESCCPLCGNQWTLDMDDGVRFEADPKGYTVSSCVAYGNSGDAIDAILKWTCCRCDFQVTHKNISKVTP